MKKRVILAAILLGISLGMLSGCNRGEKEVTMPMESGGTEGDSSELTEGNGLYEEGENSLQEDTEPEELKHETQNSSTVLEDEEALYFCGRQYILKWDKNTQTTDIIWMTDKEKIREDAYAYREMRGILIEDKIYFVESWEKNPVNPEASEDLHALSVVNTDGSGYQEIEHITDVNHLLLLDGILYFAYDVDSKALEGYVTDADGNLMIESGRVVTEPANIPEECAIMSYYDNGVRQLTPVESAYRFGYYLLYDENFNSCVVDQNTGEKRVLPEEYTNYTVRAFNAEYFLMEDFSEDVMYLVDNQTWEKNLLIDLDSYVDIIGMNEEYVYWQRHVEGDDFSQYIYERIDIETGTVEELFVWDAFVGMPDDSSWYLMDISVLNEYLYYVGVQDYKYYLMRRDVNMPGAEEIIGEAFFDSGISEIGAIKTYEENIYSENNPELKLGEIDLEWLVVDDRFPGAAQINLILEEEQKGNIAYEQDMAISMEEWMIDDIMAMGSSFSSEVSPIYYFNERFISYTQKNYDYTGGAHGMPYWVPHTFDLETGEELALSDIVANTEGEFKDIVTAQFTEMYNVEPEIYWNDAINSVHEWTTMESPFYLSEDGLVIYYGPYDLASYAAGFQEILVPYEELNLYIPIGK